MHDFIDNFLAWYLAPWRRLGRKEFGLALALATLPGLLVMFAGLGNSAGSFFEPLMNLADMGRNIGNGSDVSGLQSQWGGVQTEMLAAPGTVGVDWNGVLNGSCLLALVPLVRMRLRDMGWVGKTELAMTAAMNVSVLGGLVSSLTGYELLPLSMVWSALNFMGYAWLSFAKGRPRQAVHERVPTRWDSADIRQENREKDDNHGL